MATGVRNKEKISKDALTASSVNGDRLPLPTYDDKVELCYPNKISFDEIINNKNHIFLKYSSPDLFCEANQIVANSLVLADNFFAMQMLLESYKNKIGLIYLDPPFKTGHEFQSRQLKHAYKDLMGTASYIEFMRRRLILMRELLSDYGSIYIHIGHQMLFHIKTIMDEIFGASNFKNIIIRKKCSSKNYTRKQYPNLHDYILFYVKTKKYKWNIPGVVPSAEWINKEYTKIEKDGRRYKLVPIHAPGVRNGETGQPWKGMTPPPGKHWQFIPKILDELDERGEIHWSRNKNPRRKVYLEKDKKLPLTDYWEDFRDAHHQSILITGYPTEKNLNMLKTIVSASSDEGDIVLDPFVGSGTTLHASEELNRKWIGIDDSVEAIHATLNRFYTGLKPMGDFVQKNKPVQAGLISPLLTSKFRFSFYVDKMIYQKYPDEIQNLCVPLIN